MRYRVCKAFEFEGGHMLSKHPGRCRHPHGHSRRVEIVVSSETLDANDMVCDFKALRLAVGEMIDAWDHAMMINAADPGAARLREIGGGERIIEFSGEDPTTEVIARRIHEHVTGAIASGRPLRGDDRVEYRFPPGLTVERVRVTETSSSWAEYGH